MTNRPDNRWNKQLSLAVVDTVRQQFALGRTSSDTGWSPADVLATASECCRERGMVGMPAAVMTVTAAVNVYANVFLPWGWTLTSELAWDGRALLFERGEETLTDFLWAEPWDVPLPASAHFAEAAGRVRVLTLLQPRASREYVDGQHTPLQLKAVA